MNAKELIKHCNQVLDGDHLDIDNYVAAERVCDYVLYTVREDDDELITVEWLETNGFVNSGDDDYCQNCYLECEDGFAIQIFDGPERCVTICDKQPTRWQLRQLLRVLEVKS